MFPIRYKEVDCIFYAIMFDAVFGEDLVENTENMDRWIGCNAVVTGASAGIGMNVSLKLVKIGLNVSASDSFLISFRIFFYQFVCIILL